MLQAFLTPAEAARLLLLAHMRAGGGVGSGNFGHAGRPGAVGGSSVGQGPLAAKLVEKYGATNDPFATKFVLPNGTRVHYARVKYQSEEMTHSEMAGGPTALDHILSEGTLRYEPDGGVEASIVPTEEQAQLIADDWNFTFKNGLYLDYIARLKQPNGTYRSTHLYPPVNADAIRNWYKKVSTEVRAAGGAGSGNYGHAGRPGAVGGSTTHGPRTQALVERLGTTTNPSETVFLLKDGTRVKFAYDTSYKGRGSNFHPWMTHEQMSGGSAGLTVLLNEGVIRYDTGAGVEATVTPTYEQAQVIADDWNYVYKKLPLYVDRRDKNQSLSPVGAGVYSTHTFEMPVTPEAIRNWYKKVLVNPEPAYRAAGGTGSGNYGHAGRPGAVGGSQAGNGITVVGSSKVAAVQVRENLAKLPKSLLKESKVDTIFAMASEAEAKDKIEAYLLKHYGFSPEVAAKGLVDRERGVMYTLTDPTNTYTQFAHSLVDRIESPEFKSVIKSESSLHYAEDIFVRHFREVFTAIAEMGDPISMMLMSNPVHNLFRKWGWMK